MRKFSNIAFYTISVLIVVYIIIQSATLDFISIF
nr:MAG TPA: hypothetical protein [Caudoviricetes sp.]